MGAIGGIHYLKTAPNSGVRSVFQMLESLGHRGPLKKVCCVQKDTVLGFRYHNLMDNDRVFASDDSRMLWVIMDGEIFRDTFNIEGSRVSNRDAARILYAYAKKGESFVTHFDGSFSIVIWDEKEQKLLIVRDRVGSKPLFYTRVENTLLFASEIKAILDSGLYKTTVNLRALNYFLSFGYFPNPHTMFDSLRQVKPGHMLICKDGNIVEKPYWKFTYKHDERDKPEKQYKKEFLAILETAASRRLSRYPEAGAFLSGGLDTSAVVSIMHKLMGTPFKVFTAGFEEERYNEIGDAKVVADYLGLDHHAVTIKFDSGFPVLLEKLVWQHDAPFADTSAIPSYYAAKLAKEYVDVVLTGDFPDQLIGGSGHHVDALYRKRHDLVWKRIFRNRMLNQLVTRVHWRAGGNTFFDKAKRFLYRETFSLEEQRIIANMPIPPLLKRRLYNPDLLKINEKSDPLSIAQSLYREVDDASLLDKLLYFDILSYAPDDLMVKVDRMTQAHGLTAISPFHDLELIEFIANLPTHLKIRGNEKKYIMREVVRPLLPEQTLNKKKQGFAMPIGEWLMKKLSDYVSDVLLDSRTLNRGYFDKKFIRKMVQNFLAGKTDYASGSEATIISLITLELWHRIFIDK
jgi:asparagine synthase (glutamine-hydrolysing)